MTKFSEGDECIVTGDEADESHHFAKGEIVTLNEVQSIGTHRVVWKCYGKNAWWWVNEIDLQLTDKGPSDAEVLAAFGLAPEPTDADYLRRLSQDERIPTTVRNEIDGYLRSRQ